MDATVFSLQYGLPLYAYAKLATTFLAISNSTVNLLFPSTALSTPSETAVVLPNVDTLYSTAVFDLSRQDIVVTVPQVDADRYWNFAFYDPYGNNFANVGSVNGNSSGQYLLKRASGCDQKPKVYATADEYKGEVLSPTTYGTLLVRDLLKNNGTDLNYVQNLVKGAKLTVLPHNKTTEHAAAPLTNATFAANNEHKADIPRAIMEVLAKIAPANPPFNKSDTARVRHELRAAGIQNGTYTPPRGVDLSLAYSQVNDSIHSYATASPQNLGNGWVRNEPQGIYGSNYVDRSLIAGIGYLELTRDQVLYPRQIALGAEMALQNNQSYIYTFSTKPPIASDGFWSLTLYNAQGFVSENPLNRYSVGDRSNITYEDGTPVYGSCSCDVDGDFQVLVQSYEVPPPTNWTSNWLPAPPDGKEFSITMRLYAPLAELQDGKWEYPVVTKGVAIKG